MLEEIRADADSAAALVNRVESVRRQLLDTRDLLSARGDNDEIVEAAEALDAALIEVEQGLFQMRSTGTGQDGIRNRLERIAKTVEELPWYQTFFRFKYLDGAELDETSAETLLGNYRLALYLKDFPIAATDRRLRA